MMNKFLRLMQKMPLTLPACEAFLMQTAIAVMAEMITIDDWVYLVHLITYRVTTRLDADERSRELCAATLRKISIEKDSPRGLRGRFN